MNAVLKDLLQNKMNLDKPVLTKVLAPKLAPFANWIYIIGLIFLVLATLGALALLFRLELSSFLISLIGICAEFCLIRMFCEYLVSVRNK